MRACHVIINYVLRGELREFSTIVKGMSSLRDARLKALLDMSKSIATRDYLRSEAIAAAVYVGDYDPFTGSFVKTSGPHMSLIETDDPSQADYDESMQEYIKKVKQKYENKRS